MKNLSLAIIASTVSLFAMAQKTPETLIPEIVKANFQKQFPAAEKVKWEKEDNGYEAAFHLNQKEVSALMSTEGTLLETESEITMSELPESIHQYLSTKYAGQKIKEAEKIIDTKGMVTYEIELKGKDLLFDNNGVFIKEVNH